VVFIVYPQLGTIFLGGAGVSNRPKPTALKKLQGNPGKRPLNLQEPKPGKADIRVPRGKLPKDGQALWRVIAPVLDRLGVLTEADLPALEMLCLHYSVTRLAWQSLNDDGLTVESIVETEDEKRITIKKNPAASIFRENSLAFKSYLAEFGLTPASRVRLKVDTTEKEMSLAEMLFEAVNG
jgi:P27 family predicted phage terminase small subunit